MTTSKLAELKALRENASKEFEHTEDGRLFVDNDPQFWAYDMQEDDSKFIAAAANNWVTLIECLELADAVLKNISNRPSLPNPEKDADWKNCMKWSSAEAKEARAEIESKLGGI